MALIKDLKIGMSVDSGPFSAGLKKAEMQLGRFGAVVGRTQAAVNSFGGAMAGMGAALGLGAAAAALQDAVGRATELEKTLAGLSKATDLEGSGLSSMRDQLFSLSTELKGVKLDDVLGIATTGAKLGVASGELMEYTKGVSMLSTAMDDVPAADIADQVGKINVVFKLGVPGAMQLGSAIDKLADSGVSSARDILNVTQRIGGTTNAMKLGAPATLALAASLLDTGSSAERAAGSLSRLGMAMVQPDNRAGFAKTLGTDVKSFAAMMANDPAAAIQKYLGALNKLSAAGQISALEAVGIRGSEDPNEIIKLAGQAETFGKYLAMASREFRTLEQVTKSYAATAKTTDAAWVQFQNRVDTLKSTVGESFLPAINTSMEGFSSWLGRINAGASELITTLKAVPAAADAISKAMVPEIVRGPAAMAAKEGAKGGLKGLLAGMGGPFASLAMMASSGLEMLGGGAKPAAPPAAPRADAKAAARAAATRKKAAAQGGAAPEEEFATKGITTLIDQLKLEAATVGMTSDQLSIYKLGLAGASDAQMIYAANLAATRKARDAAFEGTTFIKGLQAQIDTFGKAGEAAKLHELRLKGVGAEQMKLAESLDKQLQGKMLTQEFMSPKAKLEIERNRLQGLFDAGQIDKTTFGKAMGAEREKLGMSNIPRFAGAAQAGSVEEYQSQIRFAAQGTTAKDEPMKATAKATEKSVDVQQQMLTALNKLVERGAGKVVDAAAELFSF